MTTVNLSRCGLKVSDQLSTTPVMKDSTKQNSLSIPSIWNDLPTATTSARQIVDMSTLMVCVQDAGFGLIKTVFRQRTKGLLTISMRKNIPAHRAAPGSLRTTSGYVRNTKPGPLFTTSPTLAPYSSAMCPRIENVTQPASSEVSVLMTHVINASLKVNQFQSSG